MFDSDRFDEKAQIPQLYSDRFRQRELTERDIQEKQRNERTAWMAPATLIIAFLTLIATIISAFK